ncbi:hypothetical protein C9374_006149 [Naegleria lovaniensis]|uniref:Uncharacterized protein n=1 Tax=Naegleria lovaniensis TaxID=51637 RepID=A0AA88GPM9_NAELO|nr:uncharacterized protein C9374_006149 [Naegleria lovaniensis]KAG2381765.1 hypothetical protein C9374_006149 [Naegleria lovaniensis]
MLQHHGQPCSCGDHHSHDDQHHSLEEECRKLSTLLFNEETRQEIEQIILDVLIPNLVSCSEFDNIEKLVDALLQNPSLFLIIYQFCFEIFAPVVHFSISLRKIGTNPELLNKVLKLISLICEHSSPKEIHSLLMESITSNMVEVELNTSDVSQNALLDIHNYGLDPQNRQLLDHQLLLLQYFFNNLSRFTENEKRWQFIKFIDVVLSRACSIRVECIQNEAFGMEEQMSQELQRKQKSDRLFLEYSSTLIDSVFTLSKYLFHNVNYESFSNKIYLRRESDCIMQACFSFLAKIYSNDQLIDVCSNNGQIDTIMKTISSCKKTLNEILEYFTRFKTWSEANKASQEDHSESDDDEISHHEDDNEDLKNFIPWDPRGIAIFLYLLFVKKLERKYYGILISSDLYLFIMTKYYVELMLQSGIASFGRTGLYILQYLFEHHVKKKGSLFMKDHVHEYDMASYFDLSQSLVSFITMCPDNKLRTFAYNIFQSFISRFEDEDRFNLLYHILNKCPYPYMVAVVLDRMKEEIILEYNALFQLIGTENLERVKQQNTYKPSQPPKLEEVNEFLKKKSENNTENYFSQFVPTNAPKLNYDQKIMNLIRLHAKDSKAFLVPHKVPNLIIELLEKYVEKPFEGDNIQVILRALNLYYFLLLRDGEPNVTGIMDTEIVSKMEDKILRKLREKKQALEILIKEQDEAPNKIWRMMTLIMKIF